MYNNRVYLGLISLSSLFTVDMIVHEMSQCNRYQLTLYDRPLKSPTWLYIVFSHKVNFPVKS